jgi:TetR/AcrR family transcriptional regulator, repressor of fatR-cypB operon
MLTRESKTRLQPATESAYSTVSDPPSKRKILQAALHLFVQKGVEGVTVREIAYEAGYTNPALFKFFSTKESLAVHLFESCYEQLFERLNGAASAGDPFDTRLRVILEVFFSQMEQDMEAFLFVQDHLRVMWPRVSKRLRKKSILALLRSVLQQGVVEGAVSATLNLDLLVTATAGTLQQFARMLYFGEFKGQVRSWSPQLESVILRILAPSDDMRSF